MPEDDLTKKLIEEHGDDFPADDTPSDTGVNDEGNDNGGDNGEDNTEDAPSGDEDNSKDSDVESSDDESSEERDEPEKDEDKPGESDDSDEPGAERVGEKKDANSRIRQLNEEKKRLEEEKREIEKRLLEKEAAELRAKDEIDDPVYTEDDFIGSLDEEGNVLSDGEAHSRFLAWQADYKLRQYEKLQVLKEEQQTLLELQSQTKEAFTKFPEFNQSSDKYDPELAAVANEALRAGLIYKEGHEGDDNFIIGSRIHPGQLLERLHKVRYKDDKPVTKVNNLGDDNGSMVGSKQVNKRINKYAPGFRGEVDKEIDKLINKEIK